MANRVAPRSNNVTPSDVPAALVFAALPIAVLDPVVVTTGFVARTVTPATTLVAAATYVVDEKPHCDMILSISDNC